MKGYLYEPATLQIWGITLITWRQFALNADTRIGKNCWRRNEGNFDDLGDYLFSNFCSDNAFLGGIVTEAQAMVSGLLCGGVVALLVIYFIDRK